jgi:hypothetical protein
MHVKIIIKTRLRYERLPSQMRTRGSHVMRNLQEASMNDVEDINIETIRVGFSGTTLVIIFYQDMKNSQRFQSVSQAKYLS